MTFAATTQAVSGLAVVGGAAASASCYVSNGDAENTLAANAVTTQDVDAVTYVTCLTAAATPYWA